MGDTVRTPRSVKATIAVLLLVELLSSLEASMIYTALPTIARQYGGMGNVGWLISAYTLVSAATVVLAARLGDMYGRRKVLLVVLGLSSFGSLVSLLSDQLAVIIVGRAIQGIAAALLPLCFGIARTIVSRQHLPVIVGLLAGVYSASGAVGFLFGGVLTETFGWHSIFAVTLVAPLLIAPLVLIFVPRDRAVSRPPSLDMTGAVLMMLGVAGLLLAVTYATRWSWMVTLALALASIATLVLWVRHEKAIEHPLIDVELLASRGVAMANLGCFCLGMGSMQLPLVVLALIQQPLWTGIGLGVGAAMAGVLKLPSNLISALAGPFSGWLGGRTSARFAAIVGGLFGLFGWAAMFFFHDNLWQVIGLSVVIGAGLAMTLSSMSNVVLDLAPHDRSSEVTGMLSVSRTLGVAFGAQVVTAVLALSMATGPNGERLPDATAYALTFAMVLAWALCGLIASVAIPAVRRARAETATAG